MSENSEPKKGSITEAQVDEVDTPRKRFSIIVALLFTAIIFGLPSWYLTTSVERVVLPIEKMNEFHEKYWSGVQYSIPVELIDLPLPLSGLVDETQMMIDQKLKDSNVDIKLLNGNSTNNLAAYRIKLVMNDEDDKLVVSPDENRLIKLYITPTIIKNGLVSDLLARVLVESIYNRELENDDDKITKLIQFPFDTKYKISVNFLHSNNQILENQDYIVKAMKNFQNFLRSFEPFADFTIEFQELWYENRIKTNDEYQDGEFTVIKDTSRFVDYSDWGLDQDFDLNPIINLNLYLPDSEKLLIENSKRNSFIIPKWGGVVILNEDEEITMDKLNEVFDIFAYQFLKLMGIDTTTYKSLYYRVDERIRMQIMKNIQETLVNYQGLIKLVSQLETIPVPLQSVNEIEESITQLNATITNLDSMKWMDAFESSTKALKVSNNAFFHKDMVQQAYFPEEHKMAVYSPLMGPFCTIMLMAIVRGVKELRQ
jgi:phosphatidylinositol glycan class S